MQPIVLEPLAITSDCPRCGAPVLDTVDTGNRRKVLEPTPCMGGLYALNSRGKAVRRRLRDVAAEYRRGAAWLGGGYAVHECAVHRSPYTG